MPTPKPNRWHPCLLPDDYLKKMRQSRAEAEIEYRSEHVLDPDAPPPDDDQSS